MDKNDWKKGGEDRWDILHPERCTSPRKDQEAARALKQTH